jgi:hypothetical protein
MSSWLEPVDAPLALVTDPDASMVAVCLALEISKISLVINLLDLDHKKICLDGCIFYDRIVEF